MVRRISIYMTMLGIVIIGTWLRFRNLSADSIWLDEATSWLESKGSLSELISATAEENYPPLHNLLLFAAMNLSGSDSEWVLRAPSALLGVGNIVAIYWLGVLIEGPITGLLAAAILATSGVHIWYSQEARMYSLLAVTATLYAAAAFFFVKSPTYTRAALFAVCGLALVYSHPFGALNWISIAIGISANILLASDVSRRTLFRWIIANAAIAAGFLPWAMILLKRSQQIGADWWAPYPSLDVVYVQLYGLLGGRLAAAALLISAAVALWASFRVSFVLFAWAVVPIGLALIESLISTHIFVARYFIGTIPAISALAAVGLAHILSRPKLPATIAAAIILAATIIGNLRYVTGPRDNWRGVAAYLRERLQNSDCVLVYPGFNIDPLRYYVRREFCAILPTSMAEIDARVIQAPRTFVVLYKTSDEANIRAMMTGYGREAEHFDTPRIEIIEYQRIENSSLGATNTQCQKSFRHQRQTPGELTDGGAHAAPSQEAC
jgi:uncharacterized membrane protein